MNQSKLFSKSLEITAVVAFTAFVASAQADKQNSPEPNFQIALHVLIGSNEASGNS